MDTPILVRGESSSGERIKGRWRDGLGTYTRRSDAIAYGSPYQKAAALVDLAEDGIGLPEEILDDQSSFEDAAKFYFIFIRFDFLWSINYFALLLLNFFEKPLWCTQDSAISCNNREYYFLGQLPYLTGVESLIYEGVTLVILMAHLFFPISYEGFNLYWRSHLNRLKIKTNASDTRKVKDSSSLELICAIRFVIVLYDDNIMCQISYEMCISYGYSTLGIVYNV